MEITKIVSWTGSPRPCVPSNTASRAPARSTWRAIPASDVPTAHPRPKYGSLLDKTAEKSMHVLAISSSEAHFGGRRFAFDPAYNYIPVPVRSRTMWKFGSAHSFLISKGSDWYYL